MLAVLILPWAITAFDLPGAERLQGARFHELALALRQGVEERFGTPFNIQRMAKGGAAVVWPPVITFLSDRGWVDMNRLVSADLGVSFVQKTLVSSDVASRDVVSSDAPAKEGN